MCLTISGLNKLNVIADKWQLLASLHVTTWNQIASKTSDKEFTVFSVGKDMCVPLFSVGLSMLHMLCAALQWVLNSVCKIGQPKQSNCLCGMICQSDWQDRRPEVFFCVCVWHKIAVKQPPKGGRGCLMSPPCLESQGCHLIPLCYLLSCSSA